MFLSNIWLPMIFVVVMCIVAYKFGLITPTSALSTPISMDERKAKYVKETSDTQPVEGQTEAQLYKLHMLFYDGIPDTYDGAGNKVQGISPDPAKALAYLEAACKFGNPKLWLKLAGIHQHGMYKYEPDLLKARDLYYQIQEAFPQGDIVSEAAEQLNSTITEIHNIRTYKWLNLPYVKKNVHHNTIQQQLQQAGARTGTRTRTGAGPNEVILATDLFRTYRNDDIFTDDDPRRNDMQNTHNSQVVSTVANSLKKLESLTELKCTSTEAIRQIREYINNKPPCDKTMDALKSLDSIERNILPVTSVNMRETDALNIVWNRIMTFDNREDLKDILYGQLADMQEHGRPVCSTGRLEHIVDTLNTFDENVQIKPTYVINDEIMDKASKVHNDLINEYGERNGSEAKRLLEFGTAPDQAEFDNMVKTTIRDTLHKDYVATGILTDDKFDAQMNKWIEAI